MDIYAYVYIYLYIVKISFSFVSPHFLTKFRRNETKRGLGKMKFGEISFRDETEKVYLGETIPSRLFNYVPTGNSPFKVKKTGEWF